MTLGVSTTEILAIARVVCVVCGVLAVLHVYLQYVLCTCQCDCSCIENRCMYIHTIDFKMKNRMFRRKTKTTRKSNENVNGPR